MDKNDLLKMLEIRPREAKRAPSRDEEAFQEDSLELTALRTDEWDLSQGKKLQSKHGKVSSDAWADFHSVCFHTSPELTEGCIDKRRHEFVKDLLANPECESVRQTTKLHQQASEIACVSFAEEYAKLLKQDQERRNKNLPPERNKRQAKSALTLSIMHALDKAEEETEKLLELQHALGMGDGQGNNSPLELSEVGRMFERVKNNELLRAIFNRAGRYRLAAQSRQRRKTKHGYEDMVGIHLDDTIEWLLSEELVSLLDEDLELDTMRRLLEKETLAYEYKGVEHVGKGPVVVCVDESGSMRGENIANAKAFALSMAWVAKHQKRWICLIGYSGGTEGTLCAMPPSRWDQERLLDWLSHFFQGGTTLDIPLAELPNKYWSQINAPKGQTDLIIITDGIVHLPSVMRDNFLEWKKKEQVRCISLILASHAGDMTQVSDEVHLVQDLGVNEKGIEACISI